MRPFQKIQLVTFGGADKKVLKDVAFSIEQVIQISVEIIELRQDISPFFDPSRRQYNADKLMALLKMVVNSERSKIIAVFKVDLYIPILTYIFGQAVLDGNYGVVSTYRLQNEKYGLPPDASLLVVRLTKEVLHELGHTFGLIHCHVPGCVMQSSTYVEDIDLKEAAYCKKCKHELSDSILNPLPKS